MKAVFNHRGRGVVDVVRVVAKVLRLNLRWVGVGGVGGWAGGG